MARRLSASLLKRAKQIQVLLMDVDGTLSRGVCLLSQADGTGMELKIFNPQDGLGMNLARIEGLHTGVITGRESAALAQRAKEMNLEYVYQKQPTKIPAYEEILKRAGVRDSAVAYLGDDLPDLPVMQRVGLALAVADAVAEVREAAHYITTARAGEGAAREVVELILKAQGRWKGAVSKARA